ncbi:hypothetical protein K144313037_19270 [Clostridium tetani]|uniref:Uncharacterized protein n=2 Tax=Clostridium tetani TaxID=1513 RepID=Q892J1_CLOTE|nr:hypothetical protein [Clostridium tetani]AAO36604.1 hypothetical protein CTC_02106 [Clostridium tetani E88]KGI39087.1 hypothetical protein KY52_04625 [Clostridium tetani]KGI39346.1 hypothetical protein LA33_01150 [Clostridium tetani ATCC 9441]KGI43656.1 hypothetical protein KY54_09915 [Clostridium tetani]KHO31378.1 hypothetical protein OR63_10685 [Clostridium tetani]
MAYTALDLLDKIIYVEEKKRDICGAGLDKAKNDMRIYILIKVMIRNLDRSIEFHKELKEQMLKSKMEEIDFIVYDKISFLIDEFSTKLLAPDIFNIKGLIKFCLEFQNDILALCIYIQGRIVQREEDMNTSTYKALNAMIVEKKKEIKNLEEFDKKYC